MSNEALQSREELAHLLGVTVRTVDELVRDGMPSIRVRRRRMFDYSDVMQWLRDRNERSKPPERQGGAL